MHIAFRVLTFLFINDIIISRYNDIKEVKQVDEKTKQVQVRLTPELHNKLKGTLALDGRKLVDFFNDAANAYLTNRAEYEKMVSKILKDERVDK